MKVGGPRAGKWGRQIGGRSIGPSSRSPPSQQRKSAALSARGQEVGRVDGARGPRPRSLAHIRIAIWPAPSPCPLKSFPPRPCPLHVRICSLALSTRPGACLPLHTTPLTMATMAATMSVATVRQFEGLKATTSFTKPVPSLVRLTSHLDASPLPRLVCNAP